MPHFSFLRPEVPAPLHPEGVHPPGLGVCSMAQPPQAETTGARLYLAQEKEDSCTLNKDVRFLMTAPGPAEPEKDGGPASFRAKRKGTTLPAAIEMRLLLLALNNS